MDNLPAFPDIPPMRRKTSILQEIPHISPPPQISIDELEEVKRHQGAAQQDATRSILIKIFNNSFIDDFIKLLPPGNGHHIRPILEVLHSDCEILINREKAYHGRLRPRIWAKRHHIPFHAYEIGTEKNPAYPSFHAATSKLFALFLSELFPHKKELFEQLANSISQSRLDAGVHFPSDITGGIEWAEKAWSAAKNRGLRPESIAVGDNYGTHAPMPMEPLR